MAELNAGVNRYVVDQAGDNGKTAFTQEAPTTVGFGESTHHFAKTADDMGIFVYSEDASSIKLWQKISGSWVDCGSTGAVGGLGGSWNVSFAWRENATHMHLQLDGPNNAVETIRVIRVEDNMFASFDGSVKNKTLLLNDAVVGDTDGDGDIDVVTGIGYRVFPLQTRSLSFDLATNTLFEWNVDAQATGGVLILNDTQVLPVTVKTAFDGTKTTFEGTKKDGTGWTRTDVLTFYFEEGSSYSGNVSDGAISGATVTDIATGATTTTDANGDFTFAVRPAGDIEATGGVDIVTGDAYVGRLKGNSKYTIISPLSTAAVEVAADSGVTFDQAVDNILDNSAFLFGIDFPKEDRLELLNKRFIDEAAAGNSKALRGAALVALIDTSAEVVGEALTHMSDDVAGNLATDADDGKREAYKGIARLVREALTTDEETKNNATSPLIASVERISTNVALNKGASRVKIEMQNERGNNYRTEVGALIEERAQDFRRAVEPSLDENYSITRVQSIAKTTRNEDITAIEAFKGREGVDAELIAATVVNTNINQIGSVPNTIIEAVKYNAEHLKDITKIELVDSFGNESDANANGRLDRNNVTKFGYFKELEVGSQLLISMSTTEEDAYVEFNLGREGALAFELALGVKYLSLKICTGEYEYTINYRGIVESKKEVVIATGLTDWSNTEVLEISVDHGAIGGGLLFEGDESGAALSFQAQFSDANATPLVPATATDITGLSREYSTEKVTSALTYTLSERWRVVDSNTEHLTRGKQYTLTNTPEGAAGAVAHTTTYTLYDGDMNNLYATVMKKEILVPIVITNGEATFTPGIENKNLTELATLKIRKKGSGDLSKEPLLPGYGDFGPPLDEGPIVELPGTDTIMPTGTYTVSLAKQVQSGLDPILFVDKNVTATPDPKSQAGNIVFHLSTPEFTFRSVKSPINEGWEFTFDNDTHFIPLNELNFDGQLAATINLRDNGVPTEVQLRVIWSHAVGIGEEGPIEARPGQGEPIAEQSAHFFTSNGTYSVTYSNSGDDFEIKYPGLHPNGGAELLQPRVADGVLSFGNTIVAGSEVGGIEEYQLRESPSKPGAFEFRHRRWESYGLPEWYQLPEGFIVGQGDEVLTIRDLNIGKGTETFIFTWTPNALEPGGGPGEELEGLASTLEQFGYEFNGSTWNRRDGGDENSAFEKTAQALIEQFMLLYNQQNQEEQGAPAPSAPEEVKTPTTIVPDGTFNIIGLQVDKLNQGLKSEALVFEFLDIKAVRDPQSKNESVYYLTGEEFTFRKSGDSWIFVHDNVTNSIPQNELTFDGQNAPIISKRFDGVPKDVRFQVYWIAPVAAPIASAPAPIVTVPIGGEPTEEPTEEPKEEQGDPGDGAQPGSSAPEKVKTPTTIVPEGTFNIIGVHPDSGIKQSFFNFSDIAAIKDPQSKNDSVYYLTDEEFFTFRKSNGTEDSLEWEFSYDGNTHSIKETGLTFDGQNTPIISILIEGVPTDVKLVVNWNIQYHPFTITTG